MNHLSTLEKYIRRFSAADKGTRLEALLDFSRKLAPLPDQFQRAEILEAHRVHECQTPVFLFLEVEGEGVRLHAEVPRESPTVRGFVSLLAHGLEGCPPSAVAELPDDLLHRLGLEEALGMMRTHGLTAIVQRVKHEARTADRTGAAGDGRKRTEAD